MKKKSMIFSPDESFHREERVGHHEGGEEKTCGVESMKDDVRRININATVPSCFSHLLHFSLDIGSTIGFSLFLLSLFLIPPLHFSATWTSHLLQARLYVCTQSVLAENCNFLVLRIACTRCDTIYLADFILSREHLDIVIFHELAM